MWNNIYNFRKIPYGFLLEFDYSFGKGITNPVFNCIENGTGIFHHPTQTPVVPAIFDGIQFHNDGYCIFWYKGFPFHGIFIFPNDEGWSTLYSYIGVDAPRDMTPEEMKNAVESWDGSIEDCIGICYMSPACGFIFCEAHGEVRPANIQNPELNKSYDEVCNELKDILADKVDKSCILHGIISDD